MKDVAFMPLEFFHQKEIVRIQGYWINIDSIYKYIIDKDLIDIKKKDIKNWSFDLICGE